MRYAKGDYTEASVSDQKAYHAICYAIAARRCKGKDANELLVLCNYYNMEKPWTKLLLAYEQGKLSAGDLLQKAQSIDEKTEANAYVGLEESVKQKTSDAQKHFQWVLNYGNKNFIEYDYVLAEMAWLRSQKSSSARPL
jgi:lipoprotein NlpI